MPQTHDPAVTDARRIIANPDPRHSDQLRKLAWYVLKSARQQRVIQSRLSPEPKGAA